MKLPPGAWIGWVRSATDFRWYPVVGADRRDGAWNLLRQYLARERGRGDAAVTAAGELPGSRRSTRFTNGVLMPDEPR